jgi:hypothetical protein
LANRVHGADFNYGASYNTIGGLQPGERNVISGNNGKGVEISHGEDTTQNIIIGNYIGTDVTGTSGPNYSRNGNYGVSIKDRVTNNQILNNVIANNNGGVIVDNYGTCCVRFNIFENNRIGVGINGEAIGNLQFGMWVIAPQSRIGPGNIIAHNPVGILIEGNTHDDNTITQNSIYANAGLGIDIAPVGQVNPNDEGDADSGPNQQLNYPVLTSAGPALVTGTACAGCQIEIFLADEDESGHGEGQTFVGGAVAAADGTFSISISGVNEGDFVTATATDSTGNTSEFSLNFEVGTGEQPPPSNPWEQLFAVPGRIEAENYRAGDAGFAYFDTTSGNSGNQYRNDDVDIEVTQDSSGDYDVAWIAPGEWLTYAIDVAESGDYQFLARVSSPNTQRRFHIEIDSVNVSGSVTVPWTGGWQNWRDVTVTIPLAAGTHVMRFVAETDRFNVNYFEITGP